MAAFAMALTLTVGDWTSAGAAGLPQTDVQTVTELSLIHISVELARNQNLKIPIVYNTSSYENVDTIRSLEGIVDILSLIHICLF